MWNVFLSAINSSFHFKRQYFISTFDYIFLHEFLHEFAVNIYRETFKLMHTCFISIKD